MNRFLKHFYELDTHELVDEINEYAKKNNLQIISLNTNDKQHGAIVLFEGNKPRWH